MSIPSRFARTVCILLSGKAGVGKTTAANFLKQRYLKEGYKAEIFSFARGVKSIAKIMSWDGNKDKAGRELLQGIGKIGRAYNENCWVSMVLDNIVPNGQGYPYDVIIVDDYRFPNESRYVANNPLYQVFEVRLYAPQREILRGTDAYFDVSEVALPEYGTEGTERYFEILINSGDIDDLDKQCGATMQLINDHAVTW